MNQSGSDTRGRGGGGWSIFVALNVAITAGTLVLASRNDTLTQAIAAATGQPLAPAGTALPMVTMPAIVPLESVIIKVKGADTDSEHYVRLAFDLEVRGEDDKPAVSARSSQIRDAVIAALLDHPLDELRGSEGLERTKSRLLQRLQAGAAGPSLKRLYVSEFVVE